MPGSITSSTMTSNCDAAGDFEAFAAVPGNHHLVAFFLKRPLEQFGHGALVLDDQDLHAKIVPAFGNAGTFQRFFRIGCVHCKV